MARLASALLAQAGSGGSGFGGGAIEVELGGRRYMEDRDTAAVVSGSKERATGFTSDGR